MTRRFYFPDPNSGNPSELYWRFKWRMGRSANSGGADDNAIGDVDAFQVGNTLITPDEGNNSGRKFLLLCRPPAIDDGSCGQRIDLDNYANNTVVPRTTRFGYENFGDAAGATNRDWGTVFDSNLHVGETLDCCYYFKAASADGVGDGVLKFWINGVQYANLTDVYMDDNPVDRMDNPSVFLSPEFDMTEYFWDDLIWSPV